MSGGPALAVLAAAFGLGLATAIRAYERLIPSLGNKNPFANFCSLARRASQFDAPASDKERNDASEQKLAVKWVLITETWYHPAASILRRPP